MRGADATEFEAGVLQALTMLNGSETEAVTDVERSGLLMALQAPWLTDVECVETLFLATLARLPSEKEQSQLMDHVSSRRVEDDRATALSNVLWALLNTAEFALNH